MDIEACTLPAPDRPLRAAEFDDLFTRVRRVERPAPTRLRLDFVEGAPATAARAADLAARETACCSFFTFTLTVSGGGTSLEVAVPPGQVAVLDALATRAAAGARP